MSTSINNKTLEKTIPSPLVKHFVEAVPPGKVLDIGCGKGHDSIFLAERGFKVIAMDTDKSCIDALSIHARQKNLSIIASQEDVRNFSFEENTYASIVAMNSLFFLPFQDFIKTISKIQTSLKKGGVVFITLFTTQDALFEKIQKENTAINQRSFINQKEEGWTFVKPKELPALFKNFEILFFKEEIIQDQGHKENPSPHTHAIARLVAKK